MEPYNTIEISLDRANHLRRSHHNLADLEPDSEFKQAHLNAEIEAKRCASEIYTKWNELLINDMKDWESKAEETLKDLKAANKLIKYSITEVENSVRNMQVIIRSIQRLESVVGIITGISPL